MTRGAFGIDAGPAALPLSPCVGLSFIFPVAVGFCCFTPELSYKEFPVQCNELLVLRLQVAAAAAALARRN